jgi:hypothetical protein
MLKKISIVLGFISTSYALAQPTSGGANVQDLQLNAITTALPFMSITPDSRAGALGDAGTALSANSNSIYWNTAMLNFAEDDSEISISYTPWLRQLTNDIHLSYVAGYKKFKRSAVAGSLRFFSLGEITFTDAAGNKLRDDKPSEWEITGGYAFKLSDRFSIGVNGKFAYSNLTGGLVTVANSKPAIAGATDISFTYFNDDARLNGNNGNLALVATLNNIGNKVAYSDVASDLRDFLPMNLKLGAAYTSEFDSYNKLTFLLDLQKLLVPTPPIRNNATGEIYSGYNNNIGVISGLMQSFYDAPGVLISTSSGPTQNPDGTYQVVKGSRLKEELREINIATGLEYWYSEMFALRGGMFYEHRTKGARQYLTAGIGLKYNIFGIDISYLASLRQGNPLANTLRFTLRFHLGNKAQSEKAPE